MCVPNRITHDLKVVLNSCLSHQSLVIHEKCSGLGNRVRCVDQSSGMGIANRRFEIALLVIEDFLDLLLQMCFLRANLGTKGEERTAQNATKLCFDIALYAIAVLPI